MLINLLGVVDVLSGIILAITGFNFAIPENFLVFFGIVLIIKSGLGFWKDFASWIDVLSGIVILLSIYIDIPLIILIVLAVLMIQKGILSFF
jgi:hypothetical protein